MTRSNPNSPVMTALHAPAGRDSPPDVLRRPSFLLHRLKPALRRQPLSPPRGLSGKCGGYSWQPRLYHEHDSTSLRHPQGNAILQHLGDLSIPFCSFLHFDERIGANMPKTRWNSRENLVAVTEMVCYNGCNATIIFHCNLFSRPCRGSRKK